MFNQRSGGEGFSTPSIYEFRLEVHRAVKTPSETYFSLVAEPALIGAVMRGELRAERGHRPDKRISALSGLLAQRLLSNVP